MDGGRNSAEHLRDSKASALRVSTRTLKSCKYLKASRDARAGECKMVVIGI